MKNNTFGVLHSVIVLLCNFNNNSERCETDVIRMLNTTKPIAIHHTARVQTSHKTHKSICLLYLFFLSLLLF